MSIRICTVPDCDRPAEAKGMCRSHYMQVSRGHAPGPIRRRIAIVPCAGPACDRPARLKGLCKTHYNQRAAGKPLTPIRERVAPGGTCPGPECSRPVRTMGLCEAHYQQQHKGRPLSPIGSNRSRKGIPQRRKPAPAVAPAPPKPKPVLSRKRSVDTVAIIVQQLDPATIAQARANLIAWGADDLLDMLGLDAA